MGRTICSATTSAVEDVVFSKFIKSYLKTRDSILSLTIQNYFGYFKQLGDWSLTCSTAAGSNRGIC